MTGTINVNWSCKKLTRFKKAFLKASDDRKEIFTFEECEFLVSYAKYLIEYLEGIL